MADDAKSSVKSSSKSNDPSEKGVVKAKSSIAAVGEKEKPAKSKCVTCLKSKCFKFYIFLGFSLLQIFNDFITLYYDGADKNKIDELFGYVT